MSTSGTSRHHLAWGYHVARDIAARAETIGQLLRVHHKIPRLLLLREICANGGDPPRVQHASTRDMRRCGTQPRTRMLCLHAAWRMRPVLWIACCMSCAARGADSPLNALGVNSSKGHSTGARECSACAGAYSSLDELFLKRLKNEIVSAWPTALQQHASRAVQQTTTIAQVFGVHVA